MVQRRVILLHSYGVCAGPDTQEDYGDPDGGLHVYAILHHLCGLFSQYGMGREIKRQIVFCLILLGHLQSRNWVQKQTCETILSLQMSASNFDSACKLSSEKLRIGYLLHRWGPCTPWLQTKARPNPVIADRCFMSHLL